MSNPPRARHQPEPNDDPRDDPGNEGKTSFAWEFVNDEQARSRPVSMPGRRTSGAPPTVRQDRPHETSNDSSHEKSHGSTPLVIDGRPRSEQPPTPSSNYRATPKRPIPSALPRSGRFGPGQANYIRDQLDRALDRWWAIGELPPLPLLRDGLLLLEGGGSVSESQRTLLLRAALAYGRGVQTALRHQVDAERIALVLTEALVEWEVPLPPDELPTMLAGDAQVQELLVNELERSRVMLTGEPRQRAQLALEVLPRPRVNRVQASPLPPLSPPPPASTPAVYERRPIRQVILVMLLVVLVGFALWQQRESTPADMIAMPAASYALLTVTGDEGGDGEAVAVTLDAFVIDRFEVTNRAYRRCVDRGACSWPLNTNSVTRTDYFTNPAFNDHPVVQVTQSMAADYCAWQEKRLPSAAEWQAAASVSPTTGQFFRYPWGQNFEAQRTNGVASGFGDTMVVGLFRPAGDSPGGASDMSGNVAEWTTTLVTRGGERPFAVVKGGSFMSKASALTVAAEKPMDVNQAAADVGFRCARSHLATR